MMLASALELTIAMLLVGKKIKAELLCVSVILVSDFVYDLQIT